MKTDFLSRKRLIAIVLANGVNVITLKLPAKSLAENDFATVFRVDNRLISSL